MSGVRVTISSAPSPFKSKDKSILSIHMSGISVTISGRGEYGYGPGYGMGGGGYGPGYGPGGPGPNRGKFLVGIANHSLPI